MVSLSAQVDTEFAEKEDLHDMEFEVELKDRMTVSAALHLALVLGLPFVFLPALAATLASFLNTSSAYYCYFLQYSIKEVKIVLKIFFVHCIDLHISTIPTSKREVKMSLYATPPYQWQLSRLSF